MHTPYIQRMVNLEPLDYRIVRRLAEQKGLGKRGFSAALRLIIRDWSRLDTARREFEHDIAEFEREAEDPAPARDASSAGAFPVA